MRVHGLVVALVLSHACVRAPLIGTGTGDTTGSCEFDDPCWAGTGDGDAIASVVVVGVLVGAFGVLAYQRLK